MKRVFGACTLELVQGDITRQDTQAIVNAANSRLAGGGGVDGAIHRAGGPSIMEETRRKYPGGCPTGSAVITGAGKLTGKHVIHAVGPVWSGGARGESDLLAGAYRRCLELAAEHEIESVAFPSISTGAYGYPVEDAAQVALETVIEFLLDHQQPKLVRFLLFDTRTLQAYASALEELGGCA